MTLYRAYRPRKFSELVGQEHVTRPLLNALKSGKIAHAYIFCGPRGSGKTSMAKLLGKAINCGSPVEGEPCGSCDFCQAADEGKLLDILELDAASNRGIAEIREIRDHVGYAAAQAKYKVYILDEAHMLTKDASNAFLKTLEEPPPHIIFILVTTEIHKIMPTIMSRCQRYEFRKIDREASTLRLQWVAEKEGIPLDEEAAHYLTLRGDGSLRDTIGLLEQVASFTENTETVTRATCIKSLGFLEDEILLEILQALARDDGEGILDVLSRFDSVGVDAKVLTRQLIEELRGMLYLVSLEGRKDPYRPGTLPRDRALELGQAFGKGRLIEILGKLSWAQTTLKTAFYPYFVLELALLHRPVAATAGAVASAQAAVSTPVPAPRPRLVEKPAPEPTPFASIVPPAPVPAPERPSRATPIAARKETPPPAAGPTPPPDVEPVISSAPVPGELDAALPSIYDAVRKQSAPTGAWFKEVVRLERRGKVVSLVVRQGHDLHMTNLRAPRHSGLIKDAFEKHLGETVTIEVVEDQAGGPAPAKGPQPRSYADEAKQAASAKGIQMVVDHFDGERIAAKENDT